MRKACCKGAFLWRTKKGPGALAGLRDSMLFASELVAQSGPSDIDRGPEVEIVFLSPRLHGVGDPAEVVVQPFAPQQPVIRKLPFESHACHPAELVNEGRVSFRQQIQSLLKHGQARMGPANASGAVEEPVGK